MKHLILTVCFCAFAASTMYSQSCDNYFPSEIGKTWEITNYNAKDKVESINKSAVTDIQQKDGGLLVSIETTTFDSKNKEVNKQSFTTFCQNGKFYIDMTSFLATENLGEDFDLEIESSNMEIPTGVSEGQKLPDAWVKMSVNMQGMGAYSQDVSFTNRMVEKFEKITTPAGTFDCVKMTWDSEMKMMFSVKSSVKTWYAVGVGEVRSEYYDQSGKLQSYSVLTSFR